MNYWEGEKIRLRAIEPEDADFFYQWNLETGTQRSLAWIWCPTSKAAVQEWARKESLKKGEEDAYNFVIERLDGTPVGTINTHTIERTDGCFRYGLGIVEQERKKGYASEAIEIILAYYFFERRYHKVNVVVYEFNQPSIKLHQRMGFVQEGRLREAKFADGRYWDIFVFGMTAAAFEQNFPRRWKL